MYVYNSSSGNVSSANTVALAPPTGALIVVFSQGSGSHAVTFSDNAGSVWANASSNVSAGGYGFSVGYCLSALAGVTTLTATYAGGTPGTCNLVGLAYTGISSPSFVAIAAPNVQASPGTAANAINSVALACGSVNALFLGYTVDVTADNGGVTAGTGFTLRYHNDPNLIGMFVEDPAAEVVGSNTALFTTPGHGTDTFVSLAVAFADNTIGPIPTSYSLESAEYF